VTHEFIDGSNNSGLNDLVLRLNCYITRMVRFCYLIEQAPDPENCVTLSTTYKDGLGMGLPRPEIHY
jgi:glucose dehydrogenase